MTDAPLAGILVAELEPHGPAGHDTSLASPIRIDGDARTSPIPTPLLGQHDAALRAWLANADHI